MKRDFLEVHEKPQLANEKPQLSGFPPLLEQNSLVSAHDQTKNVNKQRPKVVRNYLHGFFILRQLVRA